MNENSRAICSTVVLACLSAASTAGDRPRDYTAADFDVPVYSFDQGYVLAEAEDLVHSAKWVLRTDAPGVNTGCSTFSAPGYTGRGYLRWTGELLTCASQGALEGVNHSDVTQACQGSRSDWLVVKIHSSAISAVDVYMKTRVYHERQDGDNDWWRAHIGHDGQIDRGVNCQVKTYSWPDWNGEWRFRLQPGLNAVYVQGRSQGIGIDRIAVYALGRKTLALNPATQSSVPGVTGVAIVPTRSATLRGRPAVRTVGSAISIMNTAESGYLRVYDLRGRHVQVSGPGAVRSGDSERF